MTALERHEAIARHRADMARLLSAARAVPARRREEPIYRAWTLKDLLAHVAAWDRMLVGAVDELVTGRRPRFGRTSVFNKHAVNASRSHSYGDVMRELRSAHLQLMARLEALDGDEWALGTPFHWGDKTPLTVASLFTYRYKGETHYGGHAAEIEAWARG